MPKQDSQNWLKLPLKYITIDRYMEANIWTLWVIEGLACGQRLQSVTYDLGNQLDVTPFTPRHHNHYILYKVIFLTYMEREILPPWGTNIHRVSIWQLLHLIFLYNQVLFKCYICTLKLETSPNIYIPWFRSIDCCLALT